ncbi:RNA-directed DNA polymerase, eukaryota, reverse transcriptase zinc-binding domain protein [Tanacetum coccineum]
MKCYCSFVYASNNGKERRSLWKDLIASNGIVNNKPWCLLGDFNVTLKIDEHSAGESNISEDMQEFIDCINEAEVEDINSSGLFFTWIKSPLKPANSIMKKLDRIMVNQCFLTYFNGARGHFMPFMTSNNSPAVLNIGKNMNKVKKGFRFANFIVGKKEFIPTVVKGWKEEVKGHHMYKVVQKMKRLKYHMKDLAWKNGDLEERVEKCRETLKVAQNLMEKNPYDDLKAEEAKCLSKYMEAVDDAESLLIQQAKVEWISKGDRNNKFFHNILVRIRF